MTNNRFQIVGFVEFEFYFEDLSWGVALVLDAETQPRLIIAGTREEALAEFQMWVDSIGATEARARLKRFADLATAVP